MSRTRLTLGLVVGVGVAAASSFSRTLDGFLCLGVLGCLAAAAVFGLIHWLVGEWSLHRECVRTDVRTPSQTPRYWPTKEPAGG